MEKSIDEILNLFECNLEQKQISKLSPVTLAWIGDGVFSHYIRKYLVLKEGITSIDKLNKLSVGFVKAQAQSLIVHKLIKSDLTKEEIEIVKKGRNTSSHVPKHASIMDYRYATGFEALIGWLALKGDEDRIKLLCAKAIDIIEKQRARN